MPGPVLRVIRGAGAGRDIPVADELVIGREAGGDGRLDGEPALSRRHARVTRSAGGALTIEDLGSLNGTRVNGKPITAATSLRKGDEITLGQTVLVVADPADPVVRAPVARSRETVIADAPVIAAPGAGPPRAPRARPRPPRPELTDLSRLAEMPAVRAGAIAAIVLVVLAVVLLGGGGEGDKEKIVRAARSSTVQLIVQPSGIVRRLAGAVPATAPPRSGSGIVVDARRGLVLTADRLVAGATRISGRFGDGRARDATLVARAPCDGVALVRLPGLSGNTRAAELGAAGDLGRGDRVFALGYPGSRVGQGGVREGKLRAAAGAIAGGRSRATLDPADPRLSGLVLHTARPGPGGAGGPLVDGDGNVVGVDLVAPDRARITGALPIERVQGLYGDLATARTTGDAGWRLEPWSEIRGSGSSGLLVTGLDAGGGAQRASIRAADRRRARRPSEPMLGATIFAVNGRRVSDVGDVCRALAGVPRGTRVRVRADLRSAVLRGGRTGRPTRSRATVVRVGV
ncbi:MAG TPA: trypsin-like peptidase domain-containing protein [Solirubrobacteraceae bacterium]|nr:trypsin-like peptidase domain-containing protein [Solirubrobacteraceae bacterium]